MCSQFFYLATKAKAATDGLATRSAASFPESAYVREVGSVHEAADFHVP